MNLRTICALTLIFVTTIAFSQLKVISNGKVGIGSGATSPLCPLAIGGDNGYSGSILSTYGYNRVDATHDPRCSTDL